MIEVTNDDEDNNNEKIFSEENKNPLKPTELMLNPGSLTATSTPQFDINSPEEKSRRFSKLPPAPIDDPNAVQLGAKFTIIRQNSSKKEQ